MKKKFLLPTSYLQFQYIFLFTSENFTFYEKDQKDF